jgi:carbon-monoxide dehydrogenase small subunit
MVKRYQIQNKDLTENAIKEELEGNICRCTGYHNIVKSIANGASKMTN